MKPEQDTEWKGKTRGGFWGYGFFIFMIKTVGVRAAYVFLCLVIVYFIPFAPKATCNTWRYARRRLKYGCLRSACFLLRNYYRLGQTLIDKVAIGMGKTNLYRFEFSQHYPDFLDVLNQEQGVVMIGAHIGNWEIGVPFFDQYEKKMNIVMLDAEYQKIKDLLARNSRERGYKIIPVNEDNLAHVFHIKNALDKHEYVCFQGDRYVKGSQVLYGDLLGATAAFPAGPYLLSSRLDVTPVFYFAVREKGMKYKFYFILATPAKRTIGIKPEQVLLCQYIEALESVLKKYPEQWFNYYDFWNESK